MNDQSDLPFIVSATMLVCSAASIALISRLDETMKKRLKDIGYVTLVLTVVELVLCCFWIAAALQDAKDSLSNALEPIITTIGFMTVIWAWVVKPEFDRRAKEEQKAEADEDARGRLLKSLDLECSLNGIVLQITKLQSTQRLSGTGLVPVPIEQIQFLQLSNSIVEQALTSGLFPKVEYAELNNWLVPAKLDYEQFNLRILALRDKMQAGNPTQNTADHQGFLNSPYFNHIMEIHDQLDLAVAHAQGHNGYASTEM